MRVRKLALDFDGVMVDSDDLQARKAYQLFGVRIPGKLCRRGGVKGFLTVQQYNVLYKAVSGWRFGLEVEFIPGAVEYIKLLQEEVDIVSVVTARDGEFLEVAQEVSRRQGLSLDFHGVGFEFSKAAALRGYDVVLEDTIKNLIDAEGIVPHRFLFSREHNEDVVVPPGVIRVSCWCDFYERIHNLVDDAPYRPPLKSRAAAC